MFISTPPPIWQMQTFTATGTNAADVWPPSYTLRGKEISPDVATDWLEAPEPHVTTDWPGTASIERESFWVPRRIEVAKGIVGAFGMLVAWVLCKVSLVP